MAKKFQSPFSLHLTLLGRFDLNLLASLNYFCQEVKVYFDSSQGRKWQKREILTLLEKAEKKSNIRTLINQGLTCNVRIKSQGL